MNPYVQRNKGNDCKNKLEEEEEEEEKSQSLIESLGAETGLKKIVHQVLSEGSDMFKNWQAEVKTKVSMFTYFLASLISDDFVWMSTSFGGHSHQFMVQEKHFDDLIILFKKACE